MTLKFTLLFLVMCATSFSQNINELELTGTWKVENVTTNFSNVSKEQQQYIDTLKAAFNDATFEFKKDGHFNIDIDLEDISQQMKNAFWRFDPSKLKVTVVDWTEKEADKPSWEWPITISKTEEKTLFLLMESQFNLQVTKN